MDWRSTNKVPASMSTIRFRVVNATMSLLSFAFELSLPTRRGA
jgi:hypothetical protein